MKGNRTNFIEFDIDPRIRHSFWTIIFGGIFGLWGGTYGINQTEVQVKFCVFSIYKKFIHPALLGL